MEIKLKNLCRCSLAFAAAAGGAHRYVALVAVGLLEGSGLAPLQLRGGVHRYVALVAVGLIAAVVNTFEVAVSVSAEVHHLVAEGDRLGDAFGKGGNRPR